jgi:hypothetical protein
MVRTPALSLVWDAALARDLLFDPSRLTLQPFGRCEQNAIGFLAALGRVRRCSAKECRLPEQVVGICHG